MPRDTFILSATLAFASPTLWLESTSFIHSFILSTLGLIYVEIQNEMYEELVSLFFSFVYLYTSQGWIDVESFMFISCLFCLFF